MTASEALASLQEPTITNNNMLDIIHSIVLEKVDFIRLKRDRSVGPLMGIIMKRLDNSIDGSVVNDILNKEIQKILKDLL